MMKYFGYIIADRIEYIYIYSKIKIQLGGDGIQ